MITAEIKQLVKELDPIVGHDVYLCDCGNSEDCPPELTEVSVSALYDEYGFDSTTIENSPWGEEIYRLWETLTKLTTPQWETVPIVGQLPLWVVPDEQ